MPIVLRIAAIIVAVIATINLHRFIFYVAGFFRAKKYKDTDDLKTYGFIISARNEETVIGNLIDSIHNQNYPKDKIKIFLVADNCSEDDKTAEIARSKGCIVYERHDLTKARKGWALEFLFDKIIAEYGINCVDGYIFFDADNILDPNFTLEMNRAYVGTNDDLIMGYRNTKNIDSNPISAAYALHWYQQAYMLSRGRGFFGMSTRVTGTGFVARPELLKDGYHYYCLTEDWQFSVDVIAKGGKVGYCEAAEYYDEQPTNFFVSCRQRIRWARGRIYLFAFSTWKLIKGIFTNKKISRRLSCLDHAWSLFPASVLVMCLTLITPIASLVTSIFTHKFDILIVLAGIGAYYGAKYLKALGLSVLYLVREYKHIRCPLWKLILYIFVIPWYDLTTVYINFAAIFFPKGKWHPIKHKVVRTTEDLPTLLNK